MNKIICIFTVTLILINPVLAEISLRSAGPGTSISPRADIIYFKTKSTFKITFNNLSDQFIEVSPEIVFHKDKKNKKHIIRPPSDHFNPIGRIKIPPFGSITKLVPLDPKKYPALSGFKIFPKIANLKGNRPRSIVGGHFILSNLSKAKDSIAIKSKYLTKKGKTYVHSVLTNTGSGFYFDYTINDYLTDMHGNKIVSSKEEQLFKVLAPKGSREYSTLFRLKLPDGEYQHITILQNQKSKVIVTNKQKVLVKGGVIQTLGGK